MRFIQFSGLNMPLCQNAECNSTSYTNMLCKQQRAHPLFITFQVRGSKAWTESDWYMRPITWPPRAPDLTTLDFCCRNVKHAVYVQPPPITLPELYGTITAAAATGHRPRHDPRWRMGVSGAVLRTVGYSGTNGLLLVGATGCSTTAHRPKSSCNSSSA